MARGVAQAYKAPSPWRRCWRPGAAAGCWRHRASPARGGPGALATRPAGTDARQTFTYWSLRPCAAAPRFPARAQPWPRLGAPRPRRAPGAYAAPPRPVLRPRPAPPLGAGTGDMGNSRAMLSVCRVAGERPRHYKYQSLNEHYVRRPRSDGAEERAEPGETRHPAPDRARPATATTTGLVCSPPRRACRAAGRRAPIHGTGLRRPSISWYLLQHSPRFRFLRRTSIGRVVDRVRRTHVVLGSCIV